MSTEDHKTFLEFGGRRTGAGAFTESTVYDKNGIVIEPNTSERSKSGNHWKDMYYIHESLFPIMVLTEDYSNSNKDNSHFVAYQDMGNKINTFTEFQKPILKEFKASHFI